MKRFYFLAVLLVSVVLLFGVAYAQMEMKYEQHQEKMGKMGTEMKCVKIITDCSEMDHGMMLGKMGSGCCEMGSGMMHKCMKMCGMGQMMGEGMGCCKKSFFLCCKEEMDLTDEQVLSLKKIKMNFAKGDIQRDADLKIAHLELKELLGADKVDIDKAGKKIKSIASMKAEKKIAHLKSFEKAKQVLTEEQMKKVKKCHKM